MSFVFIVFRLIDRTKMRTIVLFVKCFWKKLFGINKSAVFDPYIKHKKTPGLLVCKPGCFNFIPQLSRRRAGLLRFSVVGFSFDSNTVPDTYICMTF